MKKYFLLACTLFTISTSFAQKDTTRRAVDLKASAQRNHSGNYGYNVNDLIGDKQPDVFLDVPNLSVDSINLQVKKLEARVSLDARVANLVVLKAGVDATIDEVKLDINGVKAQVLLVVRLDNVKDIIVKTLETLDKNPQLVESLLKTVDNTVNTVGGVANKALAPDGLLASTVNNLGQTVNKTLDLTGNIVESTVDATGKVLSSKTVGKLADMKKVSESKTDAGNTLTTYSGGDNTLIEVITDKTGKILSRVIKRQNF